MILSLMISLCCAVFADDTLDVATVSAKRNAAVEALSPLQSMSGAKAESIGAVGLNEALCLFAGVAVKDYGGTGGLKTVSVRNMGASHTAVIYDGIAISDAQNGQVDISRFNLDGVESISLSIGLADDIFSSARHLAAAGILRIDSRAPVIGSGQTETDIRISAGSFGTFSPYMSLRKPLGQNYALSLSATGTMSQSDYPFLLQNGSINVKGIRSNSDIRSFGGDAGFHADWGQNGKLKAQVNCHFSERGLPGSVVLYTGNGHERLWDRSVISNIMYDKDFGQTLSIHADAGFSTSYNRHLDTAPVYPEPQDSRYLQNEYSFAARALFRPNESWKMVLAEDCFINTLDSNIPECPFPLRTTSVTALSAQYSAGSFHIRASAAGTAMTEVLKDGTSSSRFRISPMVGLNWNIIKGVYLRASYKEGFRMPTFNDLYYARVGNRALRPEVARQFNIGAAYDSTWDNAGISASVDLYLNHIKDKIAATPTMFIWKMRNVGRTVMCGTDVTAAGHMRINSSLRLQWGGNYSLQYALDITDPQSKNYRHQLPYTPRHCGNFHITVNTSWVDFSYKAHAVGKRYVKSQNIPANELDGYTDHSISVSRSFQLGRRHPCRIMIGIDAMNLGDINYEVINWYPMPGRHFRFTLKFNHISNRK